MRQKVQGRVDFAFQNFILIYNTSRLDLEFVLKRGKGYLIGLHHGSYLSDCLNVDLKENIYVPDGEVKVPGCN